MNKLFGVVRAGGMEVAISAEFLHEVVAWPQALLPQIRAPDHVLGFFELRGWAIPAIDLRRLLGETAPAAAGGKIAILRTERGRLGLAVDDIARVVRARAGLLQPLDSADSAMRPWISLLLRDPDHGQLIQVLDMRALLDQPCVQLAADDGAGPPAAHRIRRAFVFFDCGELRFCLDATALREIVDRPRIETSDLCNDVYRGMIQLRGRAVPVADLFSVLGLPESGVPSLKLLVVEGNGRAIGLPISEIVAIARHAVDDVLAFRGFGLGRPGMVGGVLPGGDGGGEGRGDGPAARRDAILLEHDAILGNADVAALGRLHRGLGEGETPDAIRAAAARRTAFLSFQAGARFTAALRDIHAILMIPRQYMRMPSADGMRLGYLQHQGAMIPLIAARVLFGAPAPEAGGDALPAHLEAVHLGEADGRILLVRDGEAMFGLLVDGIETIEHFGVREDWGSRGLAGSSGNAALLAATHTLLVDAPNGPQTLAVLNLALLARTLEREHQVA